jgi:hypothetical protein
VRDAGVTVEDLTAATPEVDVWVTVAPWPQLAADARAFAGSDVALPPLSSTRGSRVLARSPVVAVAHEDRPSLDQICDGQTASWTCLADHAGQPWQELGGDPAWGTVDVALPDPAMRVDGLLTLLQMTGAYFDGAAVTGQRLEQADYAAWLSDLAREVEVDTSPLVGMLRTGPAEYEFTGALESEVVQRRTASRAGELDVSRLPPPVTAEVVAVGYGAVDTETVDAVGDLLAAPLADAGWWVDGTAPSPGPTGAAPTGGTGLPSATVLEGLRRMWIEARGA